LVADAEMPTWQAYDLSWVSEADDTRFGPLLGKLSVIMLLILQRFIRVLLETENVKKGVDSCLSQKFLSNHLDFRTEIIEACIYILATLIP
jgi:hypothetical protein